MNKRLIIILSVIVFVFILVLGFKYSSSVNISNSVELSKYISKKDGVENIDILKTDQKGDFFCVLFSNGKSNKMMILERVPILNRYVYSGGSYNDSDIGTFNFNQSSSWSLIVVYGNNMTLGAHSYVFQNNDYLFGKTNLDKYILDIYIIEDTDNPCSIGHTYDADGNELGQF